MALSRIMGCHSPPFFRDLPPYTNLRSERRETTSGQGNHTSLGCVWTSTNFWTFSSKNWDPKQQRLLLGSNLLSMVIDESSSENIERYCTQHNTDVAMEPDWALMGKCKLNHRVSIAASLKKRKEKRKAKYLQLTGRDIREIFCYSLWMAGVIIFPRPPQQWEEKQSSSWNNEAFTLILKIPFILKKNLKR